MNFLFFRESLFPETAESNVLHYEIVPSAGNPEGEVVLFRTAVGEEIEIRSIDENSGQTE